MKIYIDNDCKCYTTYAEGRRAFDVPDFDGKCKSYIEGTRYVPEDEMWTRSDGEVFYGETISPCIDSRIRAAYQAQYEAMLAEQEDMQTALETLGVTADD